MGIYSHSQATKGTCNCYLHLRATGYMQLWGVTSGSHTGLLPSLGGLIEEVGHKKIVLMCEQRGAQPAYRRGGWPDGQGSAKWYCDLNSKS